jgi:hypothetical protein
MFNERVKSRRTAQNEGVTQGGAGSFRVTSTFAHASVYEGTMDTGGRRSRIVRRRTSHGKAAVVTWRLDKQQLCVTRRISGCPFSRGTRDSGLAVDRTQRVFQAP